MLLIQNEQKLLMMRPYQVYAVKHLVTCIQQDSGNGFIWHTTGSGKTLTSFKAATLLKDNPDLAKCLFVVGRRSPSLASPATAGQIPAYRWFLAKIKAADGPRGFRDFRGPEIQVAFAA
jgi:type I site-specific restriction endonuclease